MEEILIQAFKSLEQAKLAQETPPAVKDEIAKIQNDVRRILIDKVKADAVTDLNAVLSAKP